MSPSDKLSILQTHLVASRFAPVSKREKRNCPPARYATLLLSIAVESRPTTTSHGWRTLLRSQHPAPELILLQIRLAATVQTETTRRCLATRRLFPLHVCSAVLKYIDRTPWPTGVGGKGDTAFARGVGDQMGMLVNARRERAGIPAG